MRGGDSDSLDLEISEINSRISTCRLCRLCEKRTNAVPGAGKIQNLEVMLVGEGPGRSEDLKGFPFVGAAGRLLDFALSSAGLSRSSVFITNIVKCRPPNNRKPLPDEVETCTTNYLELQIELLKPSLICSLGATSLEYFTGEKSIGKAHGVLTKARQSGIPLLPTYHPAAIFRNRSLKAIFEEEVRRIPGILEKIS